MNDKNMMSFLLYCLLTYFCVSCTSNLEELVIKDKITSEKIKTRGIDTLSADYKMDMEILAAYGYDTMATVDCDSFYLVESELIFKKTKFQEYREQNNTRLNHSTKLGARFYRLRFVLYDNQFTNKDIFREAISEWNELEKCCLNFSTDFDNDQHIGRQLINVFIQDSPQSMGGSELIRVDMGLDEKPGTNIYINSKYKYWSELSREQKKYTIMHAIGHLVRLKHSSEYDTSIMQPESGLATNKNLWNGFSFEDKVLIPELYQLNPAKTQIDYNPTPEDNKGTMKLKIGVKYTVTTSYTYEWCYNPKYTITAEPISNPGSYEFKKTGENSFDLCFVEAGECIVTFVVTDAIDGTEHKYKKKFNAAYDKPTFTVPSSIELGEYYDFKVAYQEDGFTPTFKITVEESAFDNNTAQSVSIVQVNNGHVRIKFNDYGNYKVTARVSNNRNIPARYFYFSKYYRPDYNVTSTEEGKVNEGNVNLPPSKPSQPTGENRLERYRYDISMGQAPTFEHRVACDIKTTYIQNFLKFRRIDRSYIEDSAPRVFRAGESAQLELTVYSMYHPDSLNYVDHHSILYPLKCEVIYPKDACYLKK